MSRSEIYSLLLGGLFLALAVFGDVVVEGLLGYRPDVFFYFWFVWFFLALLCFWSYARARKKRLSTNPIEETAVSATAHDLTRLLVVIVLVVIILSLVFAVIFYQSALNW